MLMAGFCASFCWTWSLDDFLFNGTSVLAIPLFQYDDIIAIPLFQYDDIIAGRLGDRSSQRARRHLNLCSGNLRRAKTTAILHSYWELLGAYTIAIINGVVVFVVMAVVTNQYWSEGGSCNWGQLG